jgi:hypothetical protein
MKAAFPSVMMTCVIVCSFPAGCSKSGPKPGPMDPRYNALSEVADLIRATTTGGKAPTQVSDFDKLESVYAYGHRAVKSGDVVVLWGGKVIGEGDAAKGGGEVIAYDKDAPVNGGFVLLSSGQVVQMTAAEFAAAPKAGGKK